MVDRRWGDVSERSRQSGSLYSCLCASIERRETADRRSIFGAHVTLVRLGSVRCSSSGRWPSHHATLPTSRPFCPDWSGSVDHRSSSSFPPAVADFDLSERGSKRLFAFETVDHSGEGIGDAIASIACWKDSRSALPFRTGLRRLQLENPKLPPAAGTKKPAHSDFEQRRENPPPSYIERAGLRRLRILLARERSRDGPPDCRWQCRHSIH